MGYDDYKDPPFSTESVGYAIGADTVTDRRFSFDGDNQKITTVATEKLRKVVKYILLSTLAQQADEDLA